MQNLWFVIPAIILGVVGIIKFISWIDTPTKPISKPTPKLGTFRIAPADTVNMFYVEEYSYITGVDKKFTEREAELYIKKRLDQREAARIRNEALREFQSRNPPREVPPFHLLEDE